MKKMTEKEFNSLMETGIEDLDWTVRPYNCLKRAGIDTLGDLFKCSKDDLIRVRNLGRKSMEEVIYKLRSLDLDLRPEDVSEEEWIEELKHRYVKEETVKFDEHFDGEQRGMRLIAKLLEIWNDDIEKEVQGLIDRNI